MTRTGKALGFVVVAIFALAGCAGCGAAATEKPAPPAIGEVTAETAALEAVGFVTDLETGPSPAVTAETRVRPRVVRKLLRRNALHGEVTVQAKDGVKTIVVQRGKITAVDGKGLTVESTDGFKLTWSYGDPLRVVQERKAVDRTALKTGVEVGLGGVENGSTTAARLIIVK